MTSEQAYAAGSSGARAAGKIREGRGFRISMDSIQDYRFRVRFDKEQYAELQMDEPPPLGGDSAPNASRILAAAVGIASARVCCSVREKPGPASRDFTRK